MSLICISNALNLTDVAAVQSLVATLDDLESALAQRCSWPQDQFDLVRSTTCYQWWRALV